MSEGPPVDFDGPDRLRREQTFRYGLKLGILVGFALCAVPVLVLVLVLG